MKLMTIKTLKKDQIVDLTDKIGKELQKIKTPSGTCLIFTAHTTCCLTTADLDPGTDLDTLEVLRKIITQINYRHPHDPNHTPDHIISSIIGPSLTIPFENQQLILGTWQRVILIELDGPRERKIHLSFF